MLDTFVRGYKTMSRRTLTDNYIPALYNDTKMLAKNLLERGTFICLPEIRGPQQQEHHMFR